MSTALFLAVAAIGLVAAVYTHLQLRHFVRGAKRLLGLRIFLIGLGVGVGIALSLLPGEHSRALAFVIGFGLSHLPPAFVLLLKRLRGERPS